MSEIIVKMPDNLPSVRIIALPEGATELAKVVKYRRYAIAVAKDGTLYSLQPLHQIRICEWWQADDALLRCLVRLKKVPKGFCERAKRESEEKEAHCDIKRRLTEFRSIASNLSLKLPASLNKAIERLEKSVTKPKPKGK